MQAIQVWKYKVDYKDLTISLFEDKLTTLREFQGRELKNKFSLIEILQHNYPLTSVEFDYDIYKKITELKQPQNLSEEELKIWQFWKAFNNENFKEEKIKLENATFFNKTKKGFVESYIRYDKKEMFHRWQSVADFFFYGPYKCGISIQDRIKLRQDIFNCLEPSKHNLKIQDSFVIFDYDKIKPVHLEKIEGITGKIFKIEKGKCIVGGWDNPRDGGENYTSVEYLWYNIESRVPKEFIKDIPYVRSVLEDAIVNY